MSDDLLPAAVAAQLRASWDRAALLLPGAAVSLAPLLSDVDGFFRLCGTAPPHTLFARSYADGGEPRTALVRRGDERELHQTGATLCLVDAHALHAPLGEYVGAATRALGFVGRVDVACELAPAGDGAGLRFDDRPRFVVQLAGTTAWAYSAAPLVDAPLGGAALGSPTQPELVEALLRPGDVIYLPPGAAHRARSEGASLTLSLAFAAPRFAETLRALMASQLDTDVEWRRRFPPLGDIDASAQAHAVRATAAARLAQLRAWAHALDEEQIVAAWDAEQSKWP